MEWLNYHHLRYFWTVAREGGVRRAAEKMRVSAPSISAQISELEEALGTPLFRRSGRHNILTEAGQLVLGYAEEIFTLGNELVHAVRQRPTAKAMRLYVGVADSFPKLVTNEILQPAFKMGQSTHVICREGKVQDLLGQLVSHRLDLVLSDEPATASLNLRVFNHFLGECSITFCASKALARKLRRNFPKSLAGAPALLPAENTAMRRNLEKWFDAHGIRPLVVAEFDDAALMKVMAADGRGVIPVPTLISREAIERYGLLRVGVAEQCTEQFYAVSAERRIDHPTVVAITANAQRLLAPGEKRRGAGAERAEQAYENQC